MEDFNGLAASLAAGVSDVRGCLILSRDGLVLGSHPSDAGEEAAKPAWVRFAALGEPERGFLQFGSEVWCYVRRGPYAAFVLTGAGVRPGLVIDQMEQALLTAEESRTKREGMKASAPSAAAEPAGAPSGKPRAPLHPESKPADEPKVIHSDAPTPTVAAQGSASVQAGSGSQQPTSAEPEEAAPTDGPKPRSRESAWATGKEEEEEGLDRFSIAREFSQLLQDEEDGADG